MYWTAQFSLKKKNHPEVKEFLPQFQSFLRFNANHFLLFGLLDVDKGYIILLQGL